MRYPYIYLALNRMCYYIRMKTTINVDEALPTMQIPSPEKIYRFIKDNSLPGKGIGWVDAALLCSAHEVRAVLATFDEALLSCAGDAGIACVPAG